MGAPAGTRSPASAPARGGSAMSERSYLEARARRHRRLAAASDHIRVRRVHEQLAEAYEARARALIER